MSRLLPLVAGLLMLAAALTGCANQRDWMKRHPRTTTFIAASLVLSATQISGHDNRPGFQGEKSTPRVDCSKSPESCQ